MSLRTDIARAMYEALPHTKTLAPDPMDWPADLWKATDAMLNVLAIVDHKLLDFARAGLPIDSGTAARFWITAVNAIKQGAA